jgi:hypothetical protein
LLGRKISYLPDRISLAFFGFDDTRLDDTFVVTEHGLDTMWLGKLTDFNVSAEFVHFVFDVGV